MKLIINKLFILIMLILLTSTIFAQLPEWQWATQTSGSDYS